MKECYDEARNIAGNFKRQSPPGNSVFVLMMVISSLLPFLPMAARGSSRTRRTKNSFAITVILVGGMHKSFPR